MRLGFLGLGNMGGPMAANLARAGHDVQGFDPVAPCPEGVTAQPSPQAAVADAEIVLTMLPDGATLRALAREVIPAMMPGAVFCDCSTVDVAAARDLALQAQATGLDALDAPVSGGVGGAVAGTLTFMVGGNPLAFARAAPLFDVMGARAVHCGAAGAGQAAKICNNMILGATMAATCEAFALADKLGLDRARMFDVVSTSSGASWSITHYCPAPGIGPVSPADHDYRPGFAAELMLKDLRLSQAAAQEVDADTPMGARARALYAEFVDAGPGAGRDFSALLPWLAGRGWPG
ncbi:MAG: 3-hydroxyisobutyrate dehydrogenase [Roseinatronobacter sp.]